MEWETTGRYFRDKLAMRMRAKSCGIPILLFVPCLTITTLILSLIQWKLLGFKTAIRASASGIIKVLIKKHYGYTLMK
jgi:hypothetical protein